MSDFLKEMSGREWPELDAYLETMVIMMTCDGSNDPREVEVFTLIGEELQRHHIPSYGPADLRARFEMFKERLETERLGRRLDAIAAALPSRAARMMALYFAMKISTADLRVVPAERDMLHKMRGHFQISDSDYDAVTIAYRSGIRPK
ncbi:MAG: TerB family tellurite resistance protein [Chloroflexi bacterium]|nr:TerB family tellurite resistance protein [Chloroflexota bacterium]